MRTCYLFFTLLESTENENLDLHILGISHNKTNKIFEKKTSETYRMIQNHKSGKGDNIFAQFTDATEFIVFLKSIINFDKC